LIQGDEVMTIKEVADYLKMNERTIYKLVQEGKIPAVKIGGQWRFKKSVVDEWLELQMISFAPSQIEQFAREAGARDVSLVSLLREEAINLSLKSRDRDGVLQELVELVTPTASLMTRDYLFRMLKQREEMVSTAVGRGVAIPHPRYHLGGMVETLPIGFGRASEGVEFGSPEGELTDLFFILCLPNDRLHLRVLAKLSRMLQDEEVLHELRAANSAGEVLNIIRKAEESMKNSRGEMK